MRSPALLATTLCAACASSQPDDERSHFAQGTVSGSTLVAADDTARVRAEFQAQFVEHGADGSRESRQSTLGATRLTLVPGSVAMRAGVASGPLAIDSIAGLGAAYSEWLDANDLEVGPMLGAQASLSPCVEASARARVTVTFLSNGSMIENYQLSVGGNLDQRVEWSAGWRLMRWDAAPQDLAREGELFFGVRFSF